MKLSCFKRRYLRWVLALSPLISGVVWGSFWAGAVGGVDDFYADGALLLLCFAAGTLLAPIRNVSVGKLGCWFIAGVCCLYWNFMLPMAFFFGLSGNPARRRGSGNFIAGLIAGVLFESSFQLPRELMLILIGGALLVPCRRERKIQYPRRIRMISSIFNIAVLAVSLYFAGIIYSGRVEADMENHREITPATWISAVGLSGKASPSVLMISKMCPKINSPLEAAVGEQIAIIYPGQSVDRKYDVVIVADAFASMRAVPGRVLNMLSPDGILVMPQKWCSLYPDFRWRTMPGAGEKSFAAAVPGRRSPLEITGERIEKNLQKILENSGKEYKNLLLPGAISGAMVDFKSVEPPLPDLPLRPEGTRKILWGAAALLILLEIILHNRPAREYACLMICGAIYGLICGILSGINAIYRYPNVEIAFFLLAVFPLWRRLIFKGTVLRVIALLSFLALGVWCFIPNPVTTLISLVLAGLYFSGCRSRYKSDGTSNMNWQDAITFAAVAGAFGLSGFMFNAAVTVVITVCILGIWLQIRS